MLFALLCGDASAPVTMALQRPGWAPTVQLTAYLRGMPADGWLRVMCTTTEVGADWFDEDHLVVDCRGRIVAQTRQLAMVPARPSRHVRPRARAPVRPRGCEPASLRASTPAIPCAREREARFTLGVEREPGFTLGGGRSAGYRGARIPPGASTARRGRGWARVRAVSCRARGGDVCHACGHGQNCDHRRREHG